MTKHILVLGFGEFHGAVWTNPQWMAYTFAEMGYQVSYFNPPLYRHPSIFDLPRVLKRLTQVVKRVPDTSGLKIKVKSRFPLTPKSIFFADNELRSAELIVLFQPLWVEYLPKESIDKCIYIKTDAYETIHEKEAINASEKKLADAGVMCFKTNSNLKYEGPNHYWPNCIPSMYLDAFTHDHERSGCIFVGTLSNLKIDVDALKSVMNDLKDVPVTIIGEFVDIAKRDVDEIINASNVKYLGKQSFKVAFQEMLKHKVGLMPFKINPYTDGMQSMKYIEYLAAGLQVVSTPIAMFNSDPNLPKSNLLVSNNLSVGYRKLITQRFVEEDLANYTYEVRIRELENLGLL